MIQCKKGVAFRDILCLQTKYAKEHPLHSIGFQNNRSVCSPISQNGRGIQTGNKIQADMK